MLHLSPESGQWVTCPVGDDGKCKLVYHAPVEEGEIAVSLLWETYAAEELYRVPTRVGSLGTKTWMNADGELHRDYNLPAVEQVDGSKEWFVDGKLHRTDGPAIKKADGRKEWYVNGERHRVDGPAAEWANGKKEWWVEGERHRLDGPAIEHADGSKLWYENGWLHRADGPAIEYANGRKQWWVNGKPVEPFSV